MAAYAVVLVCNGNRNSILEYIDNSLSLQIATCYCYLCFISIKLQTSLVCILHPVPLQQFYVACIRHDSKRCVLDTCRELKLCVDSVVDNALFLDQWHIHVTRDSDVELTQFQVTQTGSSC